MIPTPPTGLTAFTFDVSRSRTDVVDTVTVLHSNARDAAHAALRHVRKVHSIPEGIALFTTTTKRSNA